MPSLGADMDAGTLVEWRVHPGDSVRRGDIVAVVETDKSTIEVEVFEDGIVGGLLVAEGTRTPVGAPLARIDSAPAPGAAERRGELVTETALVVEPGVAPAPATTAWPPRPAVPSPLCPSPPSAPPPPLAEPDQTVLSPILRHLADEEGVDVRGVHGTGPGGRVTRADVEAAGRPEGPAGPADLHRRVSPFARRLAVELGVDLLSVSPTGPGGSIVGEDVRRAAGGRAGAEGAARGGRPAALSTANGQQAAMRRAIGSLMARSKREIPHYYLSTTIEVDRAVSFLEALNASRPVETRLVLPVLLVKATALAVASVPEMNGFMVGDRFEPQRQVHVGIAIALRRSGVIAPAIHDVAEKSLDEVMASLRDLVTRARKGVLRASEMSDPTLTVTNLGDLGVEAVFGVIYPPQVALVGFGKVSERPVATSGLVTVKRCVTATLSADHRVSDGHRGGLFLSMIDHLIQEPERL